MGGGILLILLICVLFQVKYKVVGLENTIGAMNAQIFSHEEACHILKAEWAYRTSPRRLNQLAEKYLSMHFGTPESWGRLEMPKNFPQDDPVKKTKTARVFQEATIRHEDNGSCNSVSKGSYNGSYNRSYTGDYKGGHNDR